MSLVDRFLHRAEHGRFVPLLAALCVLFVSYPMALETGYVGWVRILFILVLVAAAFAQADRPSHLAITVALAIPTAIGQLLVLVSPTQTVQIWVTGITLLFVSYVITVVLAGVLRPGKVDGNRLAGAVSVYLLLGLAWTMVYALLVLLNPGAFHLPEDMAPVLDGSPEEYAFIYYSFVTLTTLGYGDITPISPLARAASWMEAVAGQLYLAILIARLVALQIMDRAEGRSE